MIVETAAYYSHENDRWATGEEQYGEFYPISVEGQRIFTHELVAELRRHANVTGLFWWFSEENACGNAVTDGWLGIEADVARFFRIGTARHIADNSSSIPVCDTETWKGVFHAIRYFFLRMCAGFWIGDFLRLSP